MKSIKDVSLEQICKDKVYWNATRPMIDESMYFLLIDRFHDAKERISQANSSFNKGFGNEKQWKIRCGGTIKGVISHLDYIAGMGFTSIWINPFQQNNPESYHGYAIENFLAVDTGWGSTQDIIDLVNEAHKKNMRVFFDMVLNHTGDNWSYKAKAPVYNKGIHYSFGTWRHPELPIPSELRNMNRYSRKGRIRNWEQTPETWDGDLFTLKDLIQDDSVTGQDNLGLFFHIYAYWTALTGCDGFRIDTVKHIRPEWMNTFLKKLKTFATSIGKTDFFLFGEIVGGQDLIQTYPSLDGYLDYPFYFQGKDSLFARVKNDVYKEAEAGSMTPVRFLDNHDQIGQVRKERIAVGLSEQVFKNSIGAFMLLPGIPCVYYGTEQGLQGSGKGDECIRECMFDPSGSGDLLDVNTSFYIHFKNLNILRRKLLEGVDSYRFLAVVNAAGKPVSGIAAFALESETVYRMVIYNLSEKSQDVFIPLNSKKRDLKQSGQYLFTADDCLKGDVEIKNDKMTILVDSFGFYVIEFQ